MGDLGRRDFLKLIGLTSTVTAFGCSSESARKLVPYVSAPEDVLPGEAVWYASTCRECPAGCGLLAKNRDGHVIKVEGNPRHPISGGRLCPRGQASLHGLYNPDRFPGPLKREPGGKFLPIGWEEGEGFLARCLSEAIRKGRADRVVFMTDLLAGSLQDLTDALAERVGKCRGTCGLRTLFLRGSPRGQPNSLRTRCHPSLPDRSGRFPHLLQRGLLGNLAFQRGVCPSVRFIPCFAGGRKASFCLCRAKAFHDGQQRRSLASRGPR